MKPAVIQSAIVAVSVACFAAPIAYGAANPARFPVESMSAQHRRLETSEHCRDGEGAGTGEHQAVEIDTQISHRRPPDR